MQEFRPASVVQADADLADALRRGDPSAVRTFVERYAGRVHAVARSIIEDRAGAEEASRTAFVEALREVVAFEPGRDFGPWLAAIAARVATAQTDSAASGQGTDRRAEVAWTVRAAVEALDPAERDVVRLQHVEGLTHTEVADRLAIAPGTVRAHSARAHRRLVQRLAHLDTPDESGR